jgi:RimJ/RimL family protein N-acetyltransferase
VTPRELRTERLWLRPWRAGDREPFARMNADPRVMEYFPALLSRAESDAGAGRIERHFADHGWGFWAVEIPSVSAFAGFIGLAVPSFTAPFTPCVEIGWRLSPDVWGRGYATEGAQAAMACGFDQLGLDEIVAFTTVAHRKSRAVMERLGMTHDPADDFDHPNLPPGHPLRRHVLYRRKRSSV